MKIIEFQPTPNPNALKLVLDGTIALTPRSYFNAGQVAGDDLARSLFAVPGVTGLLFLNDFVTINKRPEAKWADIKKVVTKLINAEPGR